MIFFALHFFLLATIHVSTEALEYNEQSTFTFFHYTFVAKKRTGFFHTLSVRLRTSRLCSFTANWGPEIIAEFVWVKICNIHRRNASQLLYFETKIELFWGWICWSLNNWTVAQISLFHSVTINICKIKLWKPAGRQNKWQIGFVILNTSVSYEITCKLLFHLCLMYWPFNRNIILKIGRKNTHIFASLGSEILITDCLEKKTTEDT